MSTEVISVGEPPKIWVCECGTRELQQGGHVMPCPRCGKQRALEDAEEYAIPVQNMEKLAQRFDTLNRKAVRLGTPPVLMFAMGTIIREEPLYNPEDPERPLKRKVLCNRIAVWGERPQLEG